MKLKFLPLCLIPLALASCVWTPINDNYLLRNKTSYKKFDTLNEPVVMELNLKQTFAMGEYEQDRMSIGTLLVIYDWENNQVHDYVYSPEYWFTNKNEFLLPVKTADGKVKHYGIGDAAKRLTVVDPEATELQVVETNSQIYDYSMADTTYVSEKGQVIFYRKDYDNGMVIAGIKYLDVENNVLKEGEEFRCENIDKLYNGIQDKNGDFWIIYTGDEKENGFRDSYLCKVDVENGRLCGPTAIFENTKGYEVPEKSEVIYTDYFIEYVTDEYLVLSKDIYYSGSYSTETRLVIINLQENTTEEIDIDTSVHNQIVYENNGHLYLACRSAIDKWSMYELNLSSGTISFIDDYTELRYSNMTFIRGGDLYIGCTDDNGIDLVKFSSASRAFESVKKITLDELKAM